MTRRHFQSTVDYILRKLTNVSWTLSQGWEKFHLALLYVLPLLISLMELVFLIQVKVGLTVCEKFTFCFTLFMKLIFLLQPHQSSWCSLALPYVQVLKFDFGKHLNMPPHFKRSTMFYYLTFWIVQ